MAWFRQFLCQPDGKSFFVTNRQIRFAEAWTDSQTMSYDLTAGIIEINDQDKSKSTGVLYPLAQLVLDKQGRDSRASHRQGRVDRDCGLWSYRRCAAAILQPDSR